MKKIVRILLLIIQKYEENKEKEKKPKIEINEKNNEIDLNESKNDGDLLLKDEEELDNTDDNNKLIIKGENVDEKNKDNDINDNNIKKEGNNNFEKIRIISNFRNSLFRLFYFLKIFFKKNLLFFYKSSANIHNKLYMFTPCKHIFHSECLEQWLEQKKECPNCRTSFENLI